MVLPFDHTHDLDLEVSSSRFEIALFQELEGWLTWNERDESWSFIDQDQGLWLTITMVGWVDVPDSDRGDFRHWSAVDISSFF